MNQNTEKLVQLLRSNRRMDGSILAAYCRVTSKYGDNDDAAALFRVFAEQPSDYRRTMLLDPIMRCGDLALAEEIGYFCFEHGMLKEDMPSELLHVLGYMGYEKYTGYMVDCIGANDYDLSQNACLGLLHLPCESYQEQLEKELEKVYGQALFPEFLPALSFKFADEQIIPRLLAWGEQASTDCNAGLVFGISMFGEAQKDQIKRILMNPHWEMYSTGTGSHWWGYMSMQTVGLTFGELVADFKGRSENAGMDKQTMEYELEVLHDLLELKLADDPHPARFSPLNPESVTDLYQKVFQWSSEHNDDSVPGRISSCLGYKHPLLYKYMHLRFKMELGMRQELELQALTKHG